MKNKLNDHSLLKGFGIPQYDEITPFEINKNIPLLINYLSEKLYILEKNLSENFNSNNSINWENVMTPLHEIEEKLRWSWGTVGHLNAVRNTPELREAYSKQQPAVVRFINQIGQNKVIYKALNNLKNNTTNILNETQYRIIDSEIRSMRNRGVGLEGEEKKLFNKRSELLAELSTKFSNNVLDSTNSWGLLLTKDEEIEGLPLRTLEILAAAAKEAGDKNESEDIDPSASKGPWKMGLDIPRYIPFMTFAKNRSLRETVYRAYVSKASKGEFNNQQIIEEILDLRNQQANQLGFSNWADISLTNKMAGNVKAVEELLEELRSAAMPYAKKELKALEECAKRNGAKKNSKIEPWDIPYWSEILKKELFNLDQEKLRPWFPLEKVLNGLFHLCNRLFDITITSADGEVPIWNKDVRFFNLIDNDGEKIASFFLDPYSRPSNKRGGAWMDECLSRQRGQNGKMVLPVAYLVCNQTPPVGDKPSLMSFEEVETLFHEFGHGLQHMLTKVNFPQAAGINNVEWDAVELPSQFMENWCLDKGTINKIAKHWETGESLPDTEFKKLLTSRTFNAGLTTLRQIHFALTDLRLHSEWKKGIEISPDELRRQVGATTTIIKPIPEDQFLCSFTHIFAGGYSAGYYSYKWAEVLSADAFSAFEEVGLNNEKEIRAKGKQFRDSVLSLGGSKPPGDIFKSFRGREPSTDALIRHCGLNRLNA